MTASQIKESFGELPKREQLRLLSDLWAQLSHDDEELELSAEDQAELERRYAEHVADPSTSIPWETVKRELRSRD